MRTSGPAVHASPAEPLAEAVTPSGLSEALAGAVMPSGLSEAFAGTGTPSGLGEALAGAVMPSALGEALAGAVTSSAFGEAPADRVNRCVRDCRLRSGRCDRGAATLWVLAVGLALVAAGAAGAAVGAARVARHEARVAADLGALAGAMRAIEGPEAACARAADLVARNGGRLAECTVDGLDVVLTVEVDVTPLPGLTRTTRAKARAGPVRAP